MQPNRLKLRNMIILVGMLAGFGILTVAVVFGSYVSDGSDRAMLAAVGAANVSILVGSIVTLYVAWSQQSADRAPTTCTCKGADHPGGGLMPFIDRSIIIIIIIIIAQKSTGSVGSTPG